MADSIDWGAAQTQLKQKAGSNYDDSMFGDLQRNASNGTGPGGVTQAGVDDWINRIANKSQLKSTNDPNSTYQANGMGGTTTNQAGKVNSPAIPYPTIAGGGLPPATAQMATPFGAAGAGSTTFSSTSGIPGPWGDKANGLYDALMKRSQQSLDVNGNDPIIANQVNAATADATRAMRHSIDSQAEAGGPNANLDTQRRMAAEGVAQGAGNLRASLMGNELTARRTEIQNALAQMGGMLTAQQQLGLQQELGLIDANLRQQGINSGNDQFAQTFGLNAVNQANFWNAHNSGNPV